MQFITINERDVATEYQVLYCIATTICTWQRLTKAYILDHIEAAPSFGRRKEESRMELQTRLQIAAIAMSFGFVAAIVLGIV